MANVEKAPLLPLPDGWYIHVIRFIFHFILIFIDIYSKPMLVTKEHLHVAKCCHNCQVYYDISLTSVGIFHLAKHASWLETN